MTVFPGAHVLDSQFPEKLRRFGEIGWKMRGNLMFSLPRGVVELPNGTRVSAISIFAAATL